MAMTLIKKTTEYKIFKRGDGRFAVQNAQGKPVNGEEKVRGLGGRRPDQGHSALDQGCR